MKQEHENLTANQSLDIITQMIHQAKGNVKHGSFHYLLWGWVVTIANLGMYTLIQLDYPKPYMIWLITLPAWIGSAYYGYKQGQKKRIATHIDTITMWLWISYGICIATLVPFGNKIQWNINPVIILVTAIPTFISGITIRFKPLIIGGIFIWIMGIASFLVGFEYQFLAGAFAVIIGYLIPGYMLRNLKD